MSEAERMSARYKDDGQVFFDNDRVHIEDACADACEYSESRDAGTTRYVFPDGSVITVAGDAWDIGYRDCYCWRTFSHRGCCEAKEVAGRIT